jgi:uncharacterized alkaline shock family protein YloU
LTIARLAALAVSGVAGVAPIPGGVNRLFRRGSGDGVRIEVEQDRVSADLHLTLNHDVNVKEVSRQVQQEVARAIQELVGMSVQRVDVHIEEIAFPNGERDSGG